MLHSTEKRKMNAEEEFDAMDGMDEGMKGSGRSSDGNGLDGEEPSPPSDSNVKKRKSPSGAEKTSSTSGRADKLPENESDKVAPRKSKKVIVFLLVLSFLILHFFCF